jgi:solute carrier family 35 protein C2
MDSRTFSQKVLQKSQLGLQNPLDFIFHIQPFMILTILPLAVYVEGEHAPILRS